MGVWVRGHVGGWAAGLPKASVNLKTRRAIAGARAARLATKEEELLQALSKHTAALAVHKHIQQKVERLQQFVDGPLAEDLTSKAKLEEATEALTVTKKTGEKHELFLRHVAEIDLEVLKRRQAEVAALLEALGTAQIVAAEAKDDITASAWEDSREKDVVCKLKRSETQVADCEKVVQEASTVERAAGHKGSHYHQRALADRGVTLKAEDEGKHTVFVGGLGDCCVCI